MNYLNNVKIVGILGGMGPYATLMFLKNILDLTKANKDWDHIRTITDSNVHIPSRSRAVIFGETSPLKGMIDSCKKLEKYPVDAIYIPCNSASLWADQIQMKIKIPIVNIVSVATKYMFETYKVKKITSLGGMVPYQTDIYKNNTELYGAHHSQVSEALQKRVVGIIERVKKGENIYELKELFSIILKDTIRETSAEGIILACTEFSEFRNIEMGLPIVDSSYELAKHVVGFAKKGVQIPLNTNKIKTFWDLRAQMLVGDKVGKLQSTMLTLNENEAKKKWEMEKSTLLTIIKQHLPKDGVMLELGCGIGRWSRVFSKFVKSINAYDYSCSFIEMAKDISIQENIHNIDFYCSDVIDIELKQQYDIVVSVALFHYLNEVQFQKAIEIIKDSLINGGVAILRESFGYKKRFELHGYYSEILDEEYHAIYRTSEEIIESFGSNFSIIENTISLSPTEKKPETCQRILVLRKTCD